ncbi:hypothetical protein B0H14DRAFT_2570130 [Mycena olivaceomarginata]|nr:hypothetical protein B0H14DRAFT_2570130 [Mycena olivaceomarginata]
MDHLSLGGCTNPKCGIGCGIFVPSPSSVPGEHPALVNTSKRIFGSRAYVPSATAAAGGTTEKLSGPFRAMAQKREEKIAAGLAYPSNTTSSTPFNPAANLKKAQEKVENRPKGDQAPPGQAADEDQVDGGMMSGSRRHTRCGRYYLLVPSYSAYNGGAGGLGERTDEGTECEEKARQD